MCLQKPPAEEIDTLGLWLLIKSKVIDGGTMPHFEAPL